MVHEITYGRDKELWNESGGSGNDNKGVVETLRYEPKDLPLIQCRFWTAGGRTKRWLRF